MELHRLDGLPISGLDNVDIQEIGELTEDIAFEMVDDELEEEPAFGMEGLGYVKDPEIAYEILDEDGNVVMYADADENLFMVDGLGELGFFKKIGKGLRNASLFLHKKVAKPVAKGVKNAAKFTVKKVIKPVVKFANRYLNPATILLRNGFLLAMKLNFMKVAEKLRFGYLSDAEAKKRDVNTSGFSKLKKAISSAEKVYETAGGKKSNLRKAILSGKGNKDKSVPLSGPELNGLGLADEGEYVDEFEKFIAEADLESVETFLQGEMHIEGLGEVATGSALAAASSAVAAVATVLSKITGVFDKAKKTTETVVDTGKNLVSSAKAIVNTVRPVQRPAPVKQTTVMPRPPLRLPSSTRPLQTATTRSVRPAPVRTATPKVPATVKAIARQSTASPMTTTRQANTVVREDNTGKSWAEKNKILLIGTGILLAGGGAAYAIARSRKKPQQKALEGIPRNKNGKFKSTAKASAKKTSKKKVSKRKKKAVVAPKALL